MADAELQNVPQSHADAVRYLAESHAREEPGIVEIWHFPDERPVADRDKVVRLIEVNQAAISAPDLAIFPLGPSPDFPFRSAIGDVTAEQWRQIQDGRTPLPPGWDLRRAVRIWPR